MIFFWYCYDDTLARVLGISGLGEIPFWVWLVIWLADAGTRIGQTTASR